jgi:hypothetical protein
VIKLRKLLVTTAAASIVALGVPATSFANTEDLNYFTCGGGAGQGYSNTSSGHTLQATCNIVSIRFKTHTGAYTNTWTGFAGSIFITPGPATLKGAVHRALQSSGAWKSMTTILVYT